MKQEVMTLRAGLTGILPAGIKTQSLERVNGKDNIYNQGEKNYEIH